LYKPILTVSQAKFSRPAPKSVAAATNSWC
jgi:hypothetical protein